MRPIRVRTLDDIRFLAVPGVFYPGNASLLLAEILKAESVKPSTSVLDLCSGSGYLAVAAARLGARRVTAVDLSHRAVMATRINAALNRARVRVRHSDLFAALERESRFDLIVSNPPCIPSATDELPGSGIAQALDAGRDGRALIDRICAEAPGHLQPGGVLLLIQPTVGDTAATVNALARQGLDVRIAARFAAPMTPLLRERARQLGPRRSWGPGESTYEMVIVRAARMTASP